MQFQNPIPSKRSTTTTVSIKSPTVAKTRAPKAPTTPIAAGKSVTVRGFAGGSSRSKSCKVIAYVPAGANIFSTFSSAFGFNIPNGVKNMEIRFGRAVARHARYIVRETKPSEDKLQLSRIAAFYSPTATQVERQNQPTAKKPRAKRTSKVLAPVVTATPAAKPSFATPSARPGFNY